MEAHQMIIPQQTPFSDPGIAYAPTQTMRNDQFRSYPVAPQQYVQIQHPPNMQDVQYQQNVAYQQQFHPPGPLPNVYNTGGTNSFHPSGMNGGPESLPTPGMSNQYAGLSSADFEPRPIEEIQGMNGRVNQNTQYFY